MVRITTLTFCIVLSVLSFGQGITSSNLPIMVINTNGLDIQDLTRITADMGIIYNGEGQTNMISDSFNEYDGKISIEIRGSTSQFFPKKGYGLETQLDNGENNNVSLLGMPEENDWILHGPFSDKSLIRNALSFEIARLTGQYASRTRLCELVINGDYRGVYLLVEKIKRDKNRVDVSRLNPDEISGDDLTGGYIIKKDKLNGTGGDGWTSPYPPRDGAWQTTYFQYEYPKADEIVVEQKNYIENYITTFENVMLSDDFADNDLGYPAYIDVNSFVDYFLTNEICKNLDAYRLSTFMHKDKDSEGGKLKMGPVWDFNISLGNADYCSGNQTAGWVLAHRDACPNDQWITHFWWYKLMEDIEFQKKLKTRWNELRATVWSNENLLGKIDSLVALLDGGAQQRNFQKWDILSTYIWPNNIVANNYEGEIDYLKNFLTGRIAWMDLVIQQIDQPNIGDNIEVTVFPNPFQHEVFFQYTTTSNKLLKFAIYDSQGFLLDFLQPQGRDGVTIVPWERAAVVPKGVYHYAVWLNNKVIQTGSIVKQP